MSKYNKLQEYEYQKKRLQMMGLSSEEYERRIKKLAKELRV
jgi:hypothetical protein